MQHAAFVDSAQPTGTVRTNTPAGACPLEHVEEEACRASKSEQASRGLRVWILLVVPRAEPCRSNHPVIEVPCTLRRGWLAYPPRMDIPRDVRDPNFAVAFSLLDTFVCVVFFFKGGGGFSFSCGWYGL